VGDVGHDRDTGQVRVVDAIGDGPAPIVSVDHLTSWLVTEEHRALNDRSEVGGKHATFERERQMPEHPRWIGRERMVPCICPACQASGLEDDTPSGGAKCLESRTGTEE